MSRLFVITALSLCLTTPAMAQHQHGEPPSAATSNNPQPPAMPAKPALLAAKPDEMAMAVPPPDAGNDIAPDAPTDFAVDGFYSKTEMDAARAALTNEHGGAIVSKFMVDQLEYSRAHGEDGYRWNAEAWLGGDTNRFVVKTEGEGASRLDDAEVQALYSRAVGPFTNIQAGVRYDIQPDPSRAYLVLGLDALAPYWFEVAGTAFINERGDVLGRVEGSYDLLLTQRLALQPRAELNFATNGDTATGRGDGLMNADIALRLRYEVRREFAPYIGVLWQRRFGETADLARAAGEHVEVTSFVIGLRAWY